MYRLGPNFPFHLLTINKKQSYKQNIERSSHQRCSVKNGVLKNFANFTGKHLCWSLFNKVAGLFSCEICEIFKNTYLEEHLRRTASALSTINILIKGTVMQIERKH